MWNHVLHHRHHRRDCDAARARRHRRRAPERAGGAADRARLDRARHALEPRHATLATDPAPDAKARHSASARDIDQVVATYFPAPHSYTGEDVVELSAHGSPVVLRAIVAAAIEHGARLAEPGEFTLRAFLNGRIDLMQAEAVGDLIDAVTPLQARAAFDQLQGTLTRTIAEIDEALFDFIAKLEASVDFPDEGYHFVRRARDWRRSIGLIASDGALLAGARVAGSRARRAAGGDRRRAERREIEFVQRAGRRVARDRHRRAGHDARSGDRDARPRRPARDARRHRRPARNRDARRGRRRRPRAAGAAVSPT